MSKFLSLSIGLLLLFCQVRCSKVRYQLLSMRIDNVIRENNNLKSELKETKAIVDRLENKIESMEVNISLMANKAARYEEENSKALLNEKIQSFEDLSSNRLQKQFKTEAILLRKTLVNEKSHMKGTIMAFEQKFKSVQSELVKNLNAINTTVKTAVEKSISEQNITTFSMLVAVEDRLQSQLNETNLHIHAMNEDIENKLTESDKRIKEETIKLAENINNVDRALTAAKSNLRRKYKGLNKRLNNTESQLLSLSTKQERKVAFSATLKNGDKYYVKNERIVFDQVLYSHGGGYSSSKGIFTAPKSGTYLFTYNIESGSEGMAHVVLMINGETKTEVIAGGDDAINGGNSGIGYVLEGEKVWIQTLRFEDKYYISPYRTTFNGILID